MAGHCGDNYNDNGDDDDDDDDDDEELNGMAYDSFYCIW